MHFIIRLVTLVLCCASMTVDAAFEHDPLHLDWLDTHVQPSQNFYAYANGSWQKQNLIPPQYSSWGTFHILHEKVEKIIHQMLIDAANNKAAKPGSIEQKIGDFYFSGMDEATINTLGATPLQPEFSRIAAIKNLKDLQAEIAHLQQMGVDVCFSFGSMQDFKHSEKTIGVAQQGGLGLPDRDYYLKNDVKFKQVRAAYLLYMTHMFGLLGDAPAEAALEAKVVMRIETALARASMSQIAQRDPHAVYHMMNIAQIEKITPIFSWSNYLTAMGVPNIKRINLAMPNFFKTFNELLQTVSLSDWKIYLRLHLLDDFSPYLSQPFVKQRFRLASTLTGAKKLLSRWQRVVSTENEA